MMEHQWFKHEGFCPEPGRCKFCDGGLSLCLICGAAEGELTTECPGIKVNELVRSLVYKGELDFKNGNWIRIKKVEQ